MLILSCVSDGSWVVTDPKTSAVTPASTELMDIIYWELVGIEMFGILGALYSDQRIDVDGATYHISSADALAIIREEE